MTMTESSSTTITQVSELDAAKQQLQVLLADYPELATTLLEEHLSGASPLWLSRLDKLQQQVAELQRERQSLLTIASDNEALFKAYTKLNQQLYQCETVAEIKQRLREFVLQDNRLAGLNVMDVTAVANDGVAQIISKRLDSENFYFGRITQQESTTLEIVNTGSVALMLVAHPSRGLLTVIRSDDPAHFSPNSGRLLISQLQQTLAMVVSRIRG